ncbi:MAG: hypothetical protein J2P41_07560 [Blastocatellia bacterium]|nr:hypothetical protein [Blastocatellia bacterium]
MPLSMSGQRISNTSLALLALLASATVFSHRPVYCHQLIEAQRIDELRKLRDELRATESLTKSDVAVVIGERLLVHSAKQLEGLEIQLSRGGFLHLDSIDLELAPAEAIVRIGVQAKSSVNVNLNLTGRLGSGEVKGDLFQLPFQITDVSLSRGSLSSRFLRTFLGDWLTPTKWNKELPPLKLPLEISDALQIRASHFQVEGSLPMEISTPDYRSSLKFKIKSFMVLRKRLALGLEMNPGQEVNGNNGTDSQKEDAPAPPGNPSDPPNLANLEDEIARLSERLWCEKDLRLTVNRRVVSWLVEQIAAAQKNDFIIALKECRLRSEEVDSVVKVMNYTDIESGSGYADISRLSVDRIADGKLDLRLSLRGEVDSKLRGREYGIPYRLSPHTAFSIDERIVQLQTVCEGGRVLLRASPGASLPIDLRFSVKVAGRDVGINRNTAVQLDRWLNRIEIPSFFARQFSLPLLLEVDAGGKLFVKKSQKINFTISNLSVETNDDNINIIADAEFSP